MIANISTSDAMTGTFKDKINQAIDLLNSMTNAIVPIGVPLPYYGNPNDPALFDISGVGVAGSEMERYALCLGQGLSGSLLKNYDGTARTVAPDMKGKFLGGWSSSETEFAQIGITGGAKNVTLTANQSGLRGHAHLQRMGSNTSGGGNAVVANGNQDVYTAGVDFVDGVSGRTGAQNALEAHTNLPPYMSVAYIIRYK